LSSPVLAGPDAHAYTWANITHAGNRNTIASETPFRPDLQIGAVSYEFRMATTEVTVGQWFEFVEAYAPYYDLGGGIATPAFTSTSINYSFAGLFVRPDRSLDRAADMSWEYAARYVNWLHNDKVNEQWAFETGVYDTSTFTVNPDGTYNHQVARSAGARYWIPSLNEWVKAAHYDPNRYGPGQEGYWTYPNMSETQPVGALLPDEGGERNAGPFQTGIWPMDVGSFDNVRSYFGLLDLSGGVTEWLETEESNTVFGQRRLQAGTSYGEYWSDDPFNYDRIDFHHAGYVDSVNPLGGLRLASIVPAPGVPVVFGVIGITLFSRRR
jgi:formylglycine-generating enzyme required for sulfatase activity